MHLYVFSPDPTPTVAREIFSVEFRRDFKNAKKNLSQT